MNHQTKLLWTAGVKPVLHLSRSRMPLMCTVRTKGRTTIREMQGKTDGPSVGAYLLLSIPVATFCLGCWQVKRRKWKVNLIAELEQKTKAEPVPFPQDLSKLPDLEYRRVRVRGQFDHTRELYVMPRSPVSEQDREGKLIGGKSQSGACVITPFKVSPQEGDQSDSHRISYYGFIPESLTVLVNRGWVPKDQTNPRTRPQGQVSGEVELVGVVRKSEKRSVFGTANDPSRNQWFYKDSEQMAELLGTEPVMLDADSSSTVAGGPLGGQTRVTLRNEHLSYIFTWYSLCAATCYLWYRFHWIKK